ncbi:uncharacterized protein DS421_18g628010 [Arachis hypogaea]|nr:uncharacterized protein DS421_18g628010 [Arachis hypogaea]
MKPSTVPPTTTAFSLWRFIAHQHRIAVHRRSPSSPTTATTLPLCFNFLFLFFFNFSDLKNFIVVVVDDVLLFIPFIPLLC